MARKATTDWTLHKTALLRPGKTPAVLEGFSAAGLAVFHDDSMHTTASLSFGRSGYNKDGDNEDDKRCYGRSGYNKDGDNDDEKRCYGRSGYNKDGDDEGDKGRSGYN
ncbi:hypothetical protein F5Y08DRAFT_341263 [Xylaria arbuscula]|nr:hypothetical protein F5Y08DRAFT_341263 [Xylaria arbuscula]